MPKKNKYVDFVSDEHFLKCVRHVIEKYIVETKEVVEVDLKKLQKNDLDPFKMVFDVIHLGSLDTWLKKEAERQADKTLNNAVGEFHQKLLGGVNGWEDLETGDESEVDLKKKNNSIFIELKNKHNTMNAPAEKSVRNKLESIAKKYPASINYWAFVIGKKGSSGETVWIKKGFKQNPRIKKIWGKEVYKLVTGKASSLEETWNALPKAISDIIKSKNLSEKDTKRLKELFIKTFK